MAEKTTAKQSSTKPASSSSTAAHAPKAANPPPEAKTDWGAVAAGQEPHPGKCPSCGRDR